MAFISQLKSAIEIVHAVTLGGYVTLPHVSEGDFGSVYLRWRSGRTRVDVEVTPDETFEWEVDADLGPFASGSCDGTGEVAAHVLEALKAK